MIVNLKIAKAAKTLGITVPFSLLGRADQIIEWFLYSGVMTLRNPRHLTGNRSAREARNCQAGVPVGRIAL